MPRPLRIEIPGVPLHVVQRGNNREACFFSEVDRRFYLNCLRDLATRRSCAVHAYALMTNHVHLLITPAKAGAVSALLQDLGRRYVRTINAAHDRSGTLWEGRFKSNLVDSDRYLMVCHRYIELNPVRAGMVKKPGDYPWSSHAYYASGTWNPLLTEHEVYRHLGATPEERRTAFLSLFNQALDERDVNKLRTAINKGWAIGSDAFLRRMEAAVGRSVGPARRGRPRKQVEPQGGETSAQADKLL